MTFGGWGVSLNGVAVTFACDDPQAVWDELDCFPMDVYNVLDATPDGLDLPELRVEDVVYYQRDGVTTFSDWYGPRDITITGTVGPIQDDCGNGDCLTARQIMTELVQAWKRSCCDTELVVYAPCDPSDDPLERVWTGPYGAVGRPRAFKYRWLDHDQQIAQFTARFQANDQRLYILDACGTPGYTNCSEIEPGVQLFSLCGTEGTGVYAGETVICASPDGLCANGTVTTDDSVLPTEISIGGTEQVYPEITFYPPLTRPTIENVTTGEYVQLDAVLTDVEVPVTVNTQYGTAFDAEGNSLTHLLRGNLFLSLDPGNYEFRLLSAGTDEEGYSTFCTRDTVVSA